MEQIDEAQYAVNRKHPVYKAMVAARRMYRDQGMTAKEAEVATSFLYVCDGKQKGTAFRYWKKVAPNIYGITPAQFLSITAKAMIIIESLETLYECLDHGRN